MFEDILIGDSTRACGSADHCPQFQYRGFEVIISLFPQCFEIELQYGWNVQFNFYWSPRTKYQKQWELLLEVYKKRTKSMPSEFPADSMGDIHKILDEIFFPKITASMWIEALQEVQQKAFQDGQEDLRSSFKNLLRIK